MEGDEEGKPTAAGEDISNEGRAEVVLPLLIKFGSSEVEGILLPLCLGLGNQERNRVLVMYSKEL